MRIQQENTAGKVKKALFGDITGKIRTFAIISPERAQEARVIFLGMICLGQQERFINRGIL